MLTLALPAVGGASEAGVRTSAALFFVGLALTFVLVAVLPGGPGRRRWEWIPADALAVLAVLVALDVQLTEPYDNGSWVFWRSRS